MSLRDKINAQKKQIADNKAAFQRSYKFKVGTTYVRVLPGVGETRDEQEDFAVVYGAHYIKNPADDKILAVVGDAGICYGKPDPVRTAITDFMHRCNERGDENMAKKVKDWLARTQYVMNLAIVGGADTENLGKSVIWEASENQYDSVLSCVLNALEAGIDPFDLNGGLVIQVDRVGTGVQDTKYTFQAFMAANKYPANPAVLDQRVDLKSYRDGKFGQSVVKALGVMSNFLGYDVTNSAVGAAIASTAPVAAIAAPAANTPAVQAAQAAAASSDVDALLDIDAATQDAVFEEAAPAAEPTPAPAPAAATPAAPSAATAPAAGPDVDDIMAELDALNA